MAEEKCEFPKCEGDGKLRSSWIHKGSKLTLCLCDKHDQLLQDSEKAALARAKVGDDQE
jgi:hypothetical protein